jgi:hypothetical protein
MITAYSMAVVCLLELGRCAWDEWNVRLDVLTLHGQSACFLDLWLSAYTAQPQFGAASGRCRRLAVLMAASSSSCC